MEHLKSSHHREMAKLKRSSDGGDGLKTEVVQLQTEMEEMNQKYMEEIEALKNQHAEELDQLKKDMAVVLQASLSTGMVKQSDDSGNVQQLKVKIRELEGEIEELSRKYNEGIKAERVSWFMLTLSMLHYVLCFMFCLMFYVLCFLCFMFCFMFYVNVLFNVLCLFYVLCFVFVLCFMFNVLFLFCFMFNVLLLFCLMFCFCFVLFYV